MKVLVVGPDRDDPGGVANYYNAVFPRLADDAIKTHYLEIGSTKGGGKILHIIADQLRFWKMLREMRPEVVHLNPSLVPKSFFRDGFLIFQAKLLGCKVLVFFRGWDLPFEQQVTLKLGWFFSRTYMKADTFIVLASSFADTLERWGVKKPIHLGTTVVSDEDMNGFSIDDKVAKMEVQKRFKLLFLARLEWEKGVGELTQAVMRLLDQGYALELTIAGHGPALNKIRGIIGEKTLYAEYIHVIGYVRGQDKIDIFRSHHIFCLPTHYAEGMPNSVMEAMGFGMPVLTCPVGGIADFFENGVMGVLIQTPDTNNISEAIKSLIIDSEKLANISRFNHAYAKQRFLASIAAKMLQGRYLEMSVNG